MRAAVRYVLASWLSLVIGAVLGLAGMVFAPDIVDRARSIYDDAHPVVVLHDAKIERSPSEVVLEGRFEKLRDCTRITLEAYSRHAGTGALVRANVVRLGAGDEALRHIQPGDMLLGRFRIWPVVDSSAVVLYMSHMCAGRMVWTKLAEVAV